MFFFIFGRFWREVAYFFLAECLGCLVLGDSRALDKPMSLWWMLQRTAVSLDAFQNPWSLVSWSF